MSALAVEQSWDGGIPPQIRAFVLELQRYSRKASSLGVHASDMEPGDVDPEEDLAHAGPAIQTIRNLAAYAADRKPDGDTTRDEAADVKEKCTKYKLKHNTLTPGIFLIFCPHGICLCVKIMTSYEGPKTAFDIIMARFKVAPRYIIYDNCCNLHRYCIRREPGFFYRTTFLIDRMHQCNHTACHEGYFLSSLPQDEGMIDEKRDDDGRVVVRGLTVGDLNTQVCEQANARLQNVKTQCAFMKQLNFLALIRFYLYDCNMKKKKKLEMD